MYEKVKSIILQYIPGLRQTPSGWHKQNCVMCHHRGHRPDQRQRMGVKFSSDGIGVNCFNCKFSSVWTPGTPFSKKFMFFLKCASVPPGDIKKLQFELFQESSSLKPQKFEHNTTIDVISNWEESDLPDNAFPLSFWAENNCTDPEFLKCVDYLDSRRMLYPDTFYWTPEKRFMMNQRFILPFTHNNKIVGYTARLNKNTKNKRLPKYHNNMPAQFVYNLTNQQLNSREFVIVTEGVLDAFVCDGVGVMGELSKEKIDMINMLNKTVIVCPDRDYAGYELVNAAIENGWYVSFPKWHSDVKDLAKAVEKYGKYIAIKSVLDYRVSNKFEIKLKRKMDKFKGE